MKTILLTILLITFASCSNKQINNKSQTFTDYVVLNKYSEYKGQSIKEWNEQPSENFPGIRFINWINTK